jgi:hypothetical protein
MRRYILILGIVLLSSSSLSAFEDQDIDGVDDQYDLCPNTPFDATVDEKGCPFNQKLPKKFTLQLGSDLSFDQISDTSNNVNVYANYHYGQWDFSVSSANYHFTNLNINDNTQTNLFLTAGYQLKYNKLFTKLSLGTKFAFMDNNDSQRDNDYYASVNVDYYPSDKQNVFLYYNYTLSGQDASIHYDDFASYSLGTGRMFTPKWYSAVSYNHSGSIYAGAKDYKALSWFNAYNFTKDLYVSINYAHTLNHSTFRHILSINIGVHFE